MEHFINIVFDNNEEVDEKKTRSSGHCFYKPLEEETGYELYDNSRW